MPGEGGGGMGMDFVALGSQIHEDSLESMQFFTDMMNKEWEKRQKEKDDAESKRRFNVSLKEQRRGTNLGMIEALRGKREKAEQESRMRIFLKKLAA